jgi:ubiquinone biosynthesis monooxygenase Coq7
MTPFRKHSTIDRSLGVLDAARTIDAGDAQPTRPNPAGALTSVPHSGGDRRLVGGLMRINHTGEVCAQALYLGQAAVADSAATRTHLLQAASEEHDHLVWCRERLAEIAARPSVLNPLWFTCSYLIGAGAALLGDRVSLGFVVETERQVEAHLEDHLERLPLGDARTHAILTTMQREEVEHGQHALDRGAVALPQAIQRAMGLCADAMRWVAYRI